MKRLFASFTKLDTPESKKYGGGGLGLAIAKRLIDRMNGTITVESEPGVGTTFSINLIFERYRDTEVSDPMKQMLHGFRVLILDPLASRRSILAGYLDRWEAEVDQTSTPDEAMKKVEHQAQIKKPYNIIIIEKELGATDGLQYAASLKHNQVVQKSIVVLTASRDHEINSTELAMGNIVTALQQPYTMSRLRTRLKEAVTQVRRDLTDFSDGQELHGDDHRKALRILLAEDNQINQRVAMVILEKIGYKAELAVNGMIALEKYRENEYDLVLMDIQMPEMDGFEATREIRKFEKENPGRIPSYICAITANRSQEDEEKCFKAGMNNFISKPFRLEELTKVLNHL
jgi:CheY-like chemotaxis protein